MLSICSVVRNAWFQTNSLSLLCYSPAAQLSDHSRWSWRIGAGETTWVPFVPWRSEHLGFQQQGHPRLDYRLSWVCRSSCSPLWSWSAPSIVAKNRQDDTIHLSTHWDQFDPPFCYVRSIHRQAHDSASSVPRCLQEGTNRMASTNLFTPEVWACPQSFMYYY